MKDGSKDSYYKHQNIYPFLKHEIGKTIIQKERIKIENSNEFDQYFIFDNFN